LRGRLELEMEAMEEQSGFCAGRSCIDNIFCLKQIIEKRISVGREIHIVFVDLRKAFDSVPLVKLWDTMKEENINTVYINAIKGLYADCQSCVKVGSNTSSTFKINKGLRQGCCISPTLFKIYIK